MDEKGKEDSEKCFVCRGNEIESPLRKLDGKNLFTIKSAATRRRTLTSDVFKSLTGEISTGVIVEGLHYHSRCLSKYSAVKRRLIPDEDPENETPKNNETLTRSKIISCIFCGKIRKKNKLTSREALHTCDTIQGSDSILNAAKIKKDANITSLGDDLTQLNIKYHASCRKLYMRGLQTNEENHTIRKIHLMAFDKLSQYINEEIIIKQIPVMTSELLSLYSEEFISAGGSEDDISYYKTQDLLNKIKIKYEKKVSVNKESNKSGSFIHSNSISKDEAIAMINQCSVKMQQIRLAALTLRNEILSISPQTRPSPCFISTLKDAAPVIPELVETFFDTMINGIKSDPQQSLQGSNSRSTAMSADAVFNTTKGHVRPWKHQILGLGMSTLTSSKQVITILNRSGHSISYSEVKQLETEIAFSCSSSGRETPDGLKLRSDLSTGLAWDNFDQNTETPGGFNTLHATVGICYQNEIDDSESTDSNTSVSTSLGKPRRSYDGQFKPIPQYEKSLKSAKFPLTIPTNAYEIKKINLTDLGLLWLMQSTVCNMPLYNGFYSNYVQDSLPKTVITYMDPILKSPTNNDVVQETMLRTLKVASEMNQKYAIVTYDLAVALKAYSIQAIETPQFNDLIILLGAFHLELAFFGAVGTYITDSGIEYILTESGILAGGSLNGFLKGKFYNRCCRIHQIVAATMEQALFNRFKETLSCEEIDHIQEISTYCMDDEVEMVLNEDRYCKIREKYNLFFIAVLDGSLGENAAYWTQYIFMINRIYREFTRSVRCNDVSGYTSILPGMIGIFFALNRPNYARWGSLFLDKLRNMEPEALDLLRGGAFSIRRTKKNFSRSAVDITLEQTVNRDAASPMKGITNFRNSEKAFRRWCITLSQRSTALTELRKYLDVPHSEDVINQSRIRNVNQDNRDIKSLENSLNLMCNPFSPDAPKKLLNIASGKLCSQITTKYLLGSVERGNDLRIQFENQCSNDPNRFLKPVARCKVQNFAVENLGKNKNIAEEKNNVSEGVRDTFARVLAMQSVTASQCDLRFLLSHPITNVPLSLAHCDGTPNKTDKSQLTRCLEEKLVQITNKPNENTIGVETTLIDGGLLLHETLLRHKNSTYGSMARDLLTKVCAAKGNDVHLLLDKYTSPSIKDIERSNRGEINHGITFVISGPNQIQRLSGADLLRISSFKDQFGRFIMEEWAKPHYGTIIGDKVIYVSYGGMCMRYMNMVETGKSQYKVDYPPMFQGKHEEADTLIAFHCNLVGNGKITVRSSDTDVIVILLNLAHKLTACEVIIDYGAGINRRFINVSDLSEHLEESQPGFTEALLGFHALTGTDFTSSFNRKGKVKPLQLLSNSTNSQKHINALQSLASDVDVEGITSFVCAMYGEEAIDIDDVRYASFMRMNAVKKQNLQNGIRKMNCALLPPCSRTLRNHIKRSSYVTKMWKNAHEPIPTSGNNPLDYGWKLTDDCYQPDWFSGYPIPENLVMDSTNRNSTVEHDNEFDDGAWTEDSDSEDDS